MATLILFNKPYHVLSQFTDKEGGSEQQTKRKTLADFIKLSSVYPAGRLDYDSEGLLLLTDDGQLQRQISHPNYKLPKTYWVEVEGIPTREALMKLENGVKLKDGITKKAQAKLIETPNIWDRHPPVRFRENIPTQWLELIITEGRNRQVRRMTAAIGFPTLRLIRVAIGPWQVSSLKPGEWQQQTVHSSNMGFHKNASKNKVK